VNLQSRTLRHGVVLGAIVATLAGCGSSSSASAVPSGATAAPAATPASTVAPPATAAASDTAPSSGSPAAAGATYSLAFPKDTYATETKTVTTSDGTSHEVTYHLYSAIPYVAKPVDVTYESLNVEVPVSIDGTAVDASGAPIVLDIPVGGYMSSPVTGGMGGGPDGGMPGGGPGGALPSGMDPPGGAMPGGGATRGAGNSDLALAAGYVVVTPGVRGRDNQSADGTYFGKAPAAIVDLKAAVRYIRANTGLLPGNPDWIVSTGTSAGGALSALLGASGDSALYDAALAEIGAADASDAILAAAAYCPITDLEHADAIYEWTFGTLPLRSGTLDATVSQQLAAEFAPYLASLGLTAPDGTTLTAEAYPAYLLTAFLEPAATTYLAGLSDADRTSYLAANPWITWAGGKATFAWSDFLAHLGTRSKSAPAFDAFDLSTAENSEFGDAVTNARHFTEYSLRTTTGDATATLGADLRTTIDMMNPMYFIEGANPGAAKSWFLRVGTSDTDTSPAVVGDLAAALAGHGASVDSLMYWDAGHGANQDPAAFIAWIASTTGYTR
jgi:acetyl esterase/lipase